MAYFANADATADDVIYITGSKHRSWFIVAFPFFAYSATSWSRASVRARQPLGAFYVFSGCPYCGYWSRAYAKSLSDAPACDISGGKTVNQWLCQPSTLSSCPGCGGDQRSSANRTLPGVALDARISSPVFGNRSGVVNVPVYIDRFGVADSDLGVPSSVEYKLVDRGGDVERAVLSERFDFHGGELEPSFFNWEWHSPRHLSDLPPSTWTPSPSPALGGVGDGCDDGVPPPLDPSAPGGSLSPVGEGGEPGGFLAPLLGDPATHKSGDGATDADRGVGTEDGPGVEGLPAPEEVPGGQVPRRSVRLRVGRVGDGLPRSTKG